MDNLDARVTIIGGGVAGLACALSLCHDFEVSVFEAGPTLGGRACSWRDDATGDVVDIGPHILLSEYHNFLDLLQKLGTQDHIAWQDNKFITLVSDPQPVTINMHQLPPPLHFAPSLLTLPQVSLKELVSNTRVLWQVMRLSDKDADELDDVTAEDYLRQSGVAEHFLDWFWRSACMSIMNVPLERCSAGALFRFFRFMMGKSGYQVGFAAVGLGELFAEKAAERIRAAGGSVHLNSPVEAIASSADTVDYLQLQDGRRIPANTCVAAVPPQELHGLLPSHWQQLEGLRQLSEFEPSPYISVYLWFDRKLSQDSFWANVWSPETLNYDFYDLSNIRPDWRERPSVIASNIIYSHRASDLSDAEIISATLRELQAYLPVAEHARVTHSRVHRIPMAIPAPYPGSEKLRPGNATKVAGLYVAGDWTNTGLPASMESATRSGYLAAEQILAAHGITRSIATPPPVAEGLVRLVGGH